MIAWESRLFPAARIAIDASGPTCLAPSNVAEIAVFTALRKRTNDGKSGLFGTVGQLKNREFHRSNPPRLAGKAAMAKVRRSFSTQVPASAVPFEVAEHRQIVASKPRREGGVRGVCFTLLPGLPFASRSILNG